MKEEFYIEGVEVYGPGRCPECMSPITIMDVETSFMQLNKDGTPLDIDTYTTCRGVCQKCGGRYRYMRLDGKYVPESDMVLYTHLIKIRDVVKKRIEEEKGKSKENPLALK